MRYMTVLFCALACPAVADDSPAEAVSETPQFSAPIRLKGGDAQIQTERPGYASPCWADINGDGEKDLIVGQFSGGKMKIYPNLGDGTLGEGEWLMVGDAPAEVPGVW